MTIFICGDSTAASYTPDRAPLTGWGQALRALVAVQRAEASETALYQVR